MTFDRKEFLSFIIRANGEVIPAMPDDEEFSVQQIRDYVAGRPEVICETREGFLLFRDQDGNAKGLPVNHLATSIYAENSSESSPVTGRVFVAHPEHVAPYWRRRIQVNGTLQNRSGQELPSRWADEASGAR